MTMSAHDIIHVYSKGKLSTRPACYAGRGNVTTDLNSDILEMVYQGVLAEVGAEAAKSFVKMVESLDPDASATTFLLSFYHLERNGWNFKKEIIPKDKKQATTEAIVDACKKDMKSGMGAGVGAMGSHENSTSAACITADFLMRRGCSRRVRDKQRHRMWGRPGL